MACSMRCFECEKFNFIISLMEYTICYTDIEQIFRLLKHESENISVSNFLRFSEIKNLRIVSF